MGEVRLDKWLWAARFYKTRALATDAVVGGRVHLNDARVKPAKGVRVDDVLLIRIGIVEWTVVVRALADKRGPASVAQTLYEETPESAELRERRALEHKLSRPPGADLGARPTKQDRRRIEALRRGSNRHPR